MPRTAAKFTQADISRAIRAVQQTGSDMAVELRPDGVIRISRTTAEPKPEPVEAEREIVL